MLYVFVDETYTPDRRIRFACVAVQQAYFGTSWPALTKLAAQGIRRRVGLVERFLLDGEYRLVTADLNLDEARAALATLWPNGDPDGVSPLDDLWLQAFGYSIAYAVRLACRSWVFETVDVFHDPKTLQIAHEEAYQSKLREVVHRLSTREVAQVRPALRGRVKIRHISPISKPEDGKTYTKFQQGTWLAHWAAKVSSTNQVQDASGSFLYKDLTPWVLKTVEEMHRKRRQRAASREHA